MALRRSGSSRVLEFVAAEHAMLDSRNAIGKGALHAVHAAWSGKSFFGPTIPASQLPFKRALGLADSCVGNLPGTLLQATC